MEPITTLWALIVAGYIAFPLDERPDWADEASDIWVKIGFSGFSEYECRRAQYMASRELHAGAAPWIELRSISCEPYSPLDKIAGSPQIPG